MQRYNKEFSPLFARYRRARSSVSRKAAGLLVILSYPVIQPYVPVGFGRENSGPRSINSIRGNWWCVPNGNQQYYRNYDHWDFKYPSAYPEFLTPEQTASALREYNQIKHSGNSATSLARKAVEFAKRNPRHRTAPQILHLGVRATRHGCTDRETEKFSKEAFTILHKRYPRSVWTKKTPYWFK